MSFMKDVKMVEIFYTDMPSIKLRKLVTIAKRMNRSVKELNNINERVMILQEKVFLLESQLKKINEKERAIGCERYEK